MIARLPRTLAGSLVIGVLGTVGIATLAPAAHGDGIATITVTTTADDHTTDGNCSLREALQAANTDQAVDTCPAGEAANRIVLGAHTYTLGVVGEVQVQATVTIQGVSATSTVINYDPASCPRTAICTRAFYVSSGLLTMTGVTIAHAPTAIRNQATLNLDDSVINAAHVACSGDLDQAGGIENHGSATLHNVSIAHTGNPIVNGLAHTVTADGLTMTDNGPCDATGESIENSGTITLTRATFDGDINHGDGAVSILNGSTGTLNVLRSRFTHDRGGPNTGVIVNGGHALVSDSAFDRNTILPILNDGVLDVRRTRFSTNHTEYYAPGAIENVGGARLALESSTVDHNIGSVGGGIVNTTAATATLVNDTITDNIAQYGPHSGPNKPLPAGGITNDATMMIRNTTVAGNQALGFYDWHYHAGGIVTMPHGYTALSNSIVSDNSAAAPVHAQDCFGTLHSLGYNLIENSTECFVGATTTGNVIGESAHLRSLDDNGGATLTELPPWDSPAVDSGNPATPDNSDATTCTTTDQRGVSRPRDGNADGTSRCDMGALER